MREIDLYSFGNTFGIFDFYFFQLSANIKPALFNRQFISWYEDAVFTFAYGFIAPVIDVNDMRFHPFKGKQLIIFGYIIIGFKYVRFFICLGSIRSHKDNVLDLQIRYRYLCTAVSARSVQKYKYIFAVFYELTDI